MKTHVPSLVLSIVGLVFALLLPIVTYPCSIIGLVMSIKQKHEYKTMPAFVMSIIGLGLAGLNSLFGALVFLAF